MAIKQTQDYIEKMKGEGKLETGVAGWRQNLPGFPEIDYPEGKSYHWHLKTNHGEIKVRLMPEVAPNHVSNFLFLTELGYFDELNFHRVIPGFMAQGGCPQGTGTGGPGYDFDGECDPKVKHDRPGLLSMANAGPGTDGSQFFLTFVATPWLDGKHTIFGEVVEGLPVLAEVEKRGTDSGRTTEDILIEKAWVTEE